MSSRWRAVPALAVVVAGTLLAGCFGGGNVPRPPPARTPVASLTSSMDVARAAVSGALAGGGFSLEQPTQNYEPGQPASVQSVPKAVYRVNLVDIDQGWVVIYEMGSPDAAASAANDFAAYLRTQGHLNYPADAEFTLNLLDNALIFHWWSEQRSTDTARTAAAFALVAGVGQRVPVIF